MVAMRKLTDEQISFARTIVEKRREALRVADMYPTLAELADQLGVTPRYLSEVINGRARVYAIQRQSVDELIAELEAVNA